MTTTAERPLARARAASQTRDYFELSQRVKDAGLMGRDVRTYMVRTVLLALAFVGAFALLLTLGSTWWQLAVAALFGILFTQAAFLGHDAAHQQIFASGRRNQWFARIVGNLVVGLSIAWWTRKHNKHHGNPNTIGRDGDIAGGVLVFDPDDAKRRTGFMGWLAARQGWAFIPMLSLFSFVLHYEAISAVFTNERVKHRRAEAVLVLIRIIGFPVVVLSTLGLGMGAAFLAVQLAVFGIYMGGSFAPNHKGMPLIPKTLEVDFLRRQVLTSRNITGGRLMNWAMGGLDLQIEHHLFPRMPSGNLRKVRPIVKEFCAERGITYTETNLVTSYGIIIRHLNRVGLGHADPMDCPLAAQLRGASVA
ncbi:delta fatty acid desaturase [Brachybacterium sp. P6-10-X1]|uniref:fatty acid desaturase family protein n=1 Tax=Brachybacterium sp. P6-10-X1 TaxID=1903186 RepID=UPI000971A7F9|nr:acyl-CoA desaturase [Brachybacterium sp. P6-10-X1]APX31407.1 delta fatty acid desaturase [Brachybacterium sp. P6-10-X1]